MDDFDELIEQALKIRYLPLYLAGGAAALLIIFGVVWWSAVYENPYNVFWGMLSNSLQTSSVSKHIVQTSGVTSLDQYISLQYGANNFAYGRTTLKDPTSTVKTETIGTMTNDYIRYTGITTSQKGKDGKSLSFGKLLGKWAKDQAANSAQQTGQSPFFIQTVIGLSGGNTVPIVNLPKDERSNLINLLHDSVVFKTAYNNVKKSNVNGQLQYAYNVELEPVAYVAFEKQLAQYLGIKTLTQVNPNDYQSQGAIKMNFIVDARSHRLARLVIPQNNHVETYSGYGIPIRQSLPKNTISDAKLQELLTNPQ